MGFEGRTAQQMGVQRPVEPARFRHPNITLAADRTVVPCASGAETVPVTLSPFPDHGRPAFVASTIGSREELREAASKLTDTESQRLNDAARRTMETLLDTGRIESDMVLTSSQQDKPDIHVIIVGDPYSDSSLRLYCHPGKQQGIPTLFIDGRARKRGGSERVEREFRTTSGYRPPENWDNRRGRN